MEPADLVSAYARAIDGRDREALGRLFVADGTVTVRRGSADPEVHRGAEGLDAVLAAVSTFDHTLHEVSGFLLAAGEGDDEASGESACVAHHVRRTDGRDADDLVLHGRYHDTFARDTAGWHFTRRELQVLWTEKHQVRLPA
jgi:hypothetical protein